MLSFLGGRGTRHLHVPVLKCAYVCICLMRMINDTELHPENISGYFFFILIKSGFNKINIIAGFPEVLHYNQCILLCYRINSSVILG